MLRALLVLCLVASCSRSASENSSAESPSQRSGPSDDMARGTPIKLDKALTHYDLDGVPITGDIRYRVDLRAPEGQLGRASGRASLSCIGCVVGDGVAKLMPRPVAGRPPGQAGPFAGQGITIPRIALGDLRGEIEVREGKGQVALEVTGTPELSLALTGEVQLADPVGETRVQLELELAPQEALDPMARNLIAIAASSFSGDSTEPVRMTIAGSLARPRVIPQRDRQGRSAPPVVPTPNTPAGDTPAGDTPAGDTPPATAEPTTPSTTPSAPTMSDEELLQGITRRADGVVEIRLAVLESLQHQRFSGDKNH